MQQVQTPIRGRLCGASGPTSPVIRRLVLACWLIAMVAAHAAWAQLPPFNATEVGSYDEAGQDWSDVWGDGQFAYLAHFLQRVVTIVDITDPTTPVFAARYEAVLGASAQDVKVADGLMFVGLENVSPGVHIVDVRDPYAPELLTEVTALPSVHNVFYADGWLYLADSDTAVIAIVDLRTFDPDNAPATISTATWTLTEVGGQIVHDTTVKNGRLYASAWDSLQVFDVSNIATEPPQLLGSIQGDNVHAAWPTDDGRFVVGTEERGTGALTLYEIIEGVDEITLETRDYFAVSPVDTQSAHNPLIVGNRIYTSWYAAGVQVLEIDPVTATLIPVASFDTTSLDGSDFVFDGCWGVYPFLGEHKVLASDQDTGLRIIDFSDPEVLHFHGISELPKTAPSFAGTLNASIQAIGSPVQNGSVVASISVNGAPAVDVPLASQGGRDYAGQLPPAACGDRLEFSFRATNESGATFQAPPDGGSFRLDISDNADVLFADDFSSDFGWTVSNDPSGLGGWELGDPIGTGNQPEFDADGAVDGTCYFTGQFSLGSPAAASDVDGGPMILSSPAFDHGAGGGVVSYSYWLSDNTLEDALVVEVSADGVSWVEAQRHSGDNREWRRAAFDIEDFVAPSATTQIRFSITDLGGNSILEAAVDNVEVFSPDCSLIFGDGFESGDVSAWSSST